MKKDEEILERKSMEEKAGIDGEGDELIQKSFFTKDAEVKYYCEDSDTDKLMREVIFLYKKLMDIESKIKKSYGDFVNSIVDDFKKELKEQVKHVKKDGSNEVHVKRIFVSSQASNELFFI